MYAMKGTLEDQNLLAMSKERKRVGCGSVKDVQGEGGGCGGVD